MNLECCRVARVSQPQLSFLVLALSLNISKTLADMAKITIRAIFSAVFSLTVLSGLLFLLTDFFSCVVLHGK